MTAGRPRPPRSGLVCSVSQMSREPPGAPQARDASQARLCRGRLHSNALSDAFWRAPGVPPLSPLLPRGLGSALSVPRLPVQWALPATLFAFVTQATSALGRSVGPGPGHVLPPTCAQLLQGCPRRAPGCTPLASGAQAGHSQPAHSPVPGWTTGGTIQSGVPGETASFSCKPGPPAGRQGQPLQMPAGCLSALASLGPASNPRGETRVHMRLCVCIGLPYALRATTSGSHPVSRALCTTIQSGFKPAKEKHMNEMTNHKR